MFGRNKTEEPSIPVSVETYAVSLGADRLRALEQEMVASFEEWHKAQKGSAETQVLVEFQMSKWLGSAWSAWLHDRSDAPTGVMDKP